jgi:hypothetical protein
MDPDFNERMWMDPFLLELSMNYVKRAWGQLLKKFGGVQLPGGITLDGQSIYQEAQEEILRLEGVVISDFQLPVSFMVG